MSQKLAKLEVANFPVGCLKRKRLFLEPTFHIIVSSKSTTKSPLFLTNCLWCLLLWFSFFLIFLWLYSSLIKMSLLYRAINIIWELIFLGARNPTFEIAYELTFFTIYYKVNMDFFDFLHCTASSNRGNGFHSKVFMIWCPLSSPFPHSFAPKWQ